MLLGNIVLLIEHLLLFSLFVTLFWLLPGLWFFNDKQKMPTLDKLFLAISGGFALYASVVFLIRYIGLPFWVGLIPIASMSLLYLRRKGLPKFVRKVRITTAQKAFVVLTVAVILIQGAVLIRSGFRTSEGMQFAELSFHDSIWHIYLIDELKQRFPPRHAGFSPSTVKNYHFLLDLTIASIGKYLPLSTFELYYRVVPAFVSALFCLGVFVFTRQLSGSEWIANTATALGALSGNAAWVVALFRGPEFTPSANAFMLDPVVDLLQNPHAVMVFPLLLAGTIALRQLDLQVRSRWTVYSALVLGSIIGLKAWGGVLVLLALIALAGWSSIVRKLHHVWKVLLGTLALSMLLFLPLFDRQTAAGIVFVPGWLLKRMVEDPDRYNMPRFYFLEQHYRQTHNYLRLTLLNLKELFIYLFGNLWIKALGFVYFVKSFGTRIGSHLFSVTVIVLSLSFPVLFNQGRMSYDIIQFAPYALVLLAVFTALVLGQWLKHFPKKIAAAMITLLVLLSIPSNLKSIRDRVLGDQLIISNQLIEALSYLQEKTPIESVILVYPSHRNISSAMVAALAQRVTYFSANTYSRITGEDYQGREAALNTFFKNVDPDQRMRVIREGEIDYLFLLTQEDQKFNPTGLNLERVFINDAAVVYKVF